MAFGAPLDDGYLVGTKCTDAAGIGQFLAVCLDTTTAGGIVLPNHANAGKFAGINEDTGIQSDGTSGVGIAVQTGQSMRVAARRYAKAKVTSGVTIALGDSVYAAAAAAGTVTNISTSNKFVGIAVEASLGGTADVITVLVHALGGV